MKIIAFLVVAIGFVAVTEAANYGAACSDTDKCVAEKNMDCRGTTKICRCKKDTANYGKFVPNTASAADGCSEKCEGDFKCGDNAECKDKKYCQCTKGFVYDDAYKPADGTKADFACKKPDSLEKCGEAKADFQLKDAKCTCKDEKKALNYQVGTGKYKCEGNGSSNIAPMILGLVAMVSLVNYL